jgi:SAM-dependent methyltransferase
MVLDAGCGTGSLSRLISQLLPDATFVSVDISPESAKFAQRKLRGRKNTNFLSADLEFLPFVPSAFNYVVFSEVFEHILEHKRRSVLSELNRLISFSGQLFMTVPNGYYLPILFRKVVGRLSWGHIRDSITLQIYDKPPIPNLLKKDLQLTGFSVSSVSFFNFIIELGRFRIGLPHFRFFAIQFFVKASPVRKLVRLK